MPALQWRRFSPRLAESSIAVFPGDSPMTIRSWIIASTIAGHVATVASLVAAQAPPVRANVDLKTMEEQHTDAYAEQLETWLRDYLVARYPERAAGQWQRDYTSVSAFVKSVEANREGWRK